jgi:hypothetical protein
MDEEKIKKMKCKELTAELKLVKLPIYGVKAVLIERLLSYYMEYKVNNTKAKGIFDLLFDYC